jgi:hypothetical protein
MEASFEFKIFIENSKPNQIEWRGKAKVDMDSTSTCNFLSSQWKINQNSHHLDMENIIFLGQSFKWKKDHPGVTNYVKTILKVSKEEKDSEKPEFPLTYNEFI